MTATSTFPGALDGDLKALVDPASTPTAARDWMQLLGDAVTKMQVALGVNPPWGFSSLWQLPYVEVSGSAESVGTGIGTQVALGSNATESVDTHGFHSDVTNPGRLTVPAGMGGRYFGVVRSTWAANTSGQRRCNYRVNGGSDSTLYLIQTVGSASVAFAQSTSFMTTLAAGDYVEVSGAQSSGGALNFTLTQFALTRMGNNS